MEKQFLLLTWTGPSFCDRGICNVDTNKAPHKNPVNQENPDFLVGVAPMPSHVLSIRALDLAATNTPSKLPETGLREKWRWAVTMRHGGVYPLTSDLRLPLMWCTRSLPWLSLISLNAKRRTSSESSPTRSHTA